MAHLLERYTSMILIVVVRDKSGLERYEPGLLRIKAMEGLDAPPQASL